MFAELGVGECVAILLVALWGAFLTVTMHLGCKAQDAEHEKWLKRNEARARKEMRPDDGRGRA